MSLHALGKKRSGNTWECSSKSRPVPSRVRKLRLRMANPSLSAVRRTALNSLFPTTITCPAFTSPSSAVLTAAASSTKEAPTAPILMAQKFRRPCSPPATKSNPAKRYLWFASCRTISCPPPLARQPLPNRQPPPQEKSPLPLQLPLQFGRPSFPLRLHRPRRRALTRYRKRLPHPLQSKIDPPRAQLPHLQDRQHPAQYHRCAQDSRRNSPSAVGLFTRFPTVGKSRKVLAFNK